MILIDTVYIHKSGGKTLLDYFLNSLNKSYAIEKCVLLLDKRFQSEQQKIIVKSVYFVIDAGERERKKIYKRIINLHNIDTVFCFANIPPPVKLHGKRVYIFFQNTLLIRNNRSNYNTARQLFFLLKRYYIKYLNDKKYIWIVQSKLIRELIVESLVKKKNKILVLPFFNDAFFQATNTRTARFLYVADGVPQKNHPLLFSSWEQLANEYNCFPELVVTINKAEYPELAAQVDALYEKGIRINNIGIVQAEILERLYRESLYLIFPSINESFGLPLIEATLHGCKIIASDLPYVFEVVKPSFTFDPFNPEVLSDTIYRLVNHTLDLPESKIIVKNNIFKLINILKANVNVQQ